MSDQQITPLERHPSSCTCDKCLERREGRNVCLLRPRDIRAVSFNLKSREPEAQTVLLEPNTLHHLTIIINNKNGFPIYCADFYKASVLALMIRYRVTEIRVAFGIEFLRKVEDAPSHYLIKIADNKEDIVSVTLTR